MEFADTSCGGPSLNIVSCNAALSISPGCPALVCLHPPVTTVLSKLVKAPKLVALFTVLTASGVGLKSRSFFDDKSDTESTRARPGKCGEQQDSRCGVKDVGGNVGLVKAPGSSYIWMCAILGV